MSKATSACLLFRKRDLVETLAAINLDEAEENLLLNVVGERSFPERWGILTESRKGLSMDLCLCEAELEDYLENLARTYLRLWLIAKSL